MNVLINHRDSILSLRVYHDRESYRFDDEREEKNVDLWSAIVCSIAHTETAVRLILHNQIFPYEKKTQQVIEYLSLSIAAGDHAITYVIRCKSIRSRERERKREKRETISEKTSLFYSLIEHTGEQWTRTFSLMMKVRMNNQLIDQMTWRFFSRIANCNDDELQLNIFFLFFVSLFAVNSNCECHNEIYLLYLAEFFNKRNVFSLGRCLVRRIFSERFNID